jgi:hypothetical protein
LVTSSCVFSADISPVRGLRPAEFLIMPSSAPHAD